MSDATKGNPHAMASRTGIQNPFIVRRNSSTSDALYRSAISALGTAGNKCHTPGHAKIKSKLFEPRTLKTVPDDCEICICGSYRSDQALMKFLRYKPADSQDRQRRAFLTRKPRSLRPRHELFGGHSIVNNHGGFRASSRRVSRYVVGYTLLKVAFFRE
jgi:hypothetical protein